MFKKLISFFIFMISAMFVHAENSAVKEFSAKGIIADVQNFYLKAKDEKAVVSAKDRLLSSYIVLVNANGVYSFLEREENEKFLKEIKVGDHVEIKGKLLEAGFLVEIESLTTLKEKSEVDLKIVQESEGKPISLEGINKCQCGLKVGELKHSCKLGHLHHLQTEDGKIYHYLEPDKSKDMKLHFKKMKVDALLFPGNFIKIKETAK